MAFQEASSRYCPGCGGPSADLSARQCQFCAGPLVPLHSPDPRASVRCRGCATHVAQGSSFCPACGRALAEAIAGESPHQCPGCGHGVMETFGLAPTSAHPAGTPVHGCRSCGGAWADVATLKVLLAAAAAEAAATGDTPQPSNIHQRRLGGTAVVYRRCAVCGDHMHRRNFARVSGVIVDECRVHGTFFDAGELEDVLGFVRSGGLAVAARRDAEEHARELKQRHAAPPPMSMGANSGWSPDPWDAPEVDALGAFVSWAGRWVRNAFR